MRIMSSDVEEEILPEDNYEISNIILYPRRKKPIAKLFLITKKQYQLWGIGRERTTIFWIFVSKIGILIVEPKISKFFKIISKTNIPIQDGDDVGNVSDKLKNNHIFKQIKIDDNKIQTIATEFHFFLTQ
jgi:hypothetical protein